jgi:hypothetical protein
MIHPLKIWFYKRKHEKIVYLRERLRLAQVIISNQNMMKSSLEGEKGQKRPKHMVLIHTC